MWKLDPKIFLGVAGLPRLFNTQRHFLRVVSFHTWLAVCGEQYITSHYYRKYSGLSRNRSSFETGLETRPNQFQVQDKLIQRPNMGEHPRFWITCCNMIFFCGVAGGSSINMFCLKPIWTNTKVDHPSPYIYILFESGLSPDSIFRIRGWYDQYLHCFEIDSRIPRGCKSRFSTIACKIWCLSFSQLIRLHFN